MYIKYSSSIASAPPKRLYARIVYTIPGHPDKGSNPWQCRIRAFSAHTLFRILSCFKMGNSKYTVHVYSSPVIDLSNFVVNISRLCPVLFNGGLNLYLSLQFTYLWNHTVLYTDSVCYIRCREMFRQTEKPTTLLFWSMFNYKLSQ